MKEKPLYTMKNSEIKTIKGNFELLNTHSDNRN
jgi:hypothetical protein